MFVVFLQRFSGEKVKATVIQQCYIKTNNYGMAQLQGNKCMRVTCKKLMRISQVYARVLACQGITRIKISARFQLITMYLQCSYQ